MSEHALKDQVAVVTGASSGIGEATAARLAGAGAAVVAAARRRDRLDALVRRIRDDGGTATPIECDVADRAQVSDLFDAVKSEHGRVDILVNNAGIMPVAPMTECRVDDWDAMIDVNIKGLLYCMAGALPIMRAQNTGHVINVSSVAGRRTFPGAAVYCGTKHAVHAISEGTRNELAEAAADDGNRIRVTVVAPGVVTTELADSITHDASRENTKKYFATIDPALTSDDIADTIVFAATCPWHVGINEILVRPTRQIR